MTRGTLRWASVPRENFRAYLAKAEEFGRWMDRALSEGAYDSAALNAVHCVISSCDALCVYHLGRRSRGQDHHEVVLLLDQAKLPDWSVKVIQVHEVLTLKNIVEYESRRLTSGQAAKTVAQASRVLEWARRNLQ
ncbi:MAG: HEPN domain-containing protein [Euryarchaeota archaeon]|nr:HEPN domain-containing protein [Euryarchaeota archaeon]MDE1880170.1 HEPN domain-containing protein [Euryarchaeota archaeon]